MSKVFLKEVQKGNHACYELRWWEGPKRMSLTIGWVIPKGEKPSEPKHISDKEANARLREKQTEVDLAERAARMAAKLAAEEAANPTGRPVAQSNGMTLREFYGGYAARRIRTEKHNRGHMRAAPRLAEKSIDSHLMSLRYLIECFGGDRPIDSISLADAERFDERLSAGELEAARKTKQYYELKDEGVKVHLRNCKALFNFMLLFHQVQANPFALFTPTSGASRKTHHVTVGEFRKLFNAAPTRGWGMFFALCRLGGLRREAARVLPWLGEAVDSWGETHRVGVDWDRHRLMVLGNCKATEYPLRYREVPISPLLFRLLRKTYESSPARFGHPDAEAQSISGVSPHNLIRLAKRVRIKARLEPWPKLYQALRASCENDWKRLGIPEATYTVWMGHSAKISRKHYVSPLDSEFNAIAKVA